MATSLWFVLEDEDEREEVDEPSHAERPLRHSSALCCLRQSCSQPPRLLNQGCPLGGALRHTSNRCTVTPAAVVVVATPTIFAANPMVAVPTVATVAASLFPPVSLCQLFLQSSAKTQGRGPRRGLSAGPWRGQGSGRLSSV